MTNLQELTPKNETSESDRENEAVKEFLSRLHVLKEKTDAGPLAPIIGDLPKQLQREIVSSSDRLRSELLEQGLSPASTEEVIGREAKERVKEIMAAYTDKRYGSINGSYFRLELLRIIEELATSEPNLESVKSTAVISLDVNGLKTVNDINDSHQKGDFYLREIYGVLSNGQTTQDLRQRGIEVIVASNGGDEFAIILKGTESLISEETQTEALDAIVKTYQREVGALTHYTDPETHEKVPFIDFGSPEVSQKFSEAGITIPDGFEFPASISAGASTLMEAIIDYAEGVQAEGSDVGPSYNQIVNGIMGKTFTISDERSSRDKESFKEGLKKSPDERANFLGLVLSRNREVMELTLENRKLREALDSCERNLSQYQ